MMKVIAIALLTFTLVLSRDVLPGERWESGRLPINDEEIMFFWLCRARHASVRPKALVLYLNGGPGSSTISNLFFENGPYQINGTGGFNRNLYSWNEEFDILYVDNPAGVGLSESYKSEFTCNTHQCFADTLYRFLLKFYETHREYDGVPFIASGMSYAGHYISPLSAFLIRNRDNAKFINYKATILFAPWLSFEQMHHAPGYLYDTGNFTFTDYLLHEIDSCICHSLFAVAPKIALELCILVKARCEKDSGVPNVYNIAVNRTYRDEFHALEAYLTQDWVKEKIGTKKTFKTNNYTIQYNVAIHDWSWSVLPDLSLVLENDIPILFVFGDKDLIMNWNGGYHVIENISWKGHEGFKNADWEKMLDGSTEFGKKKSWGKLQFQLLYNAGHFIAHDLPKRALDSVTEFINSAIRE